MLDDEWSGALIVVADGSIVLECRGGATRSFPAGSILWFSGLGLHAARSTATAPATLVGTRRLADRGG